MHVLLGLCLNGCDRYHAHDILGAAASGQIVYRRRDALGQRAVSLCLRQSLYQLVSDVAGIQIREYEYIGMSCHLAARRLGCAHRRNDGRVKLQFSVQLQLRRKLLSPVLSPQRLYLHPHVLRFPL